MFSKGQTLTVRLGVWAGLMMVGGRGARLVFLEGGRVGGRAGGDFTGFTGSAPSAGGLKSWKLKLKRVSGQIFFFVVTVTSVYLTRFTEPIT